MTSLTLNQAREATYARWKTVWDVAQPTIPYVFENLKLPQPPETGWARVTLRTLDDRQQTMGAPGTRVYRREAQAWVQLYGPLSAGMQGLDAQVKSVRDTFEGASFGGVAGVGAARADSLGSDGRWWEVVVVCPLTYYELR